MPPGWSTAVNYLQLVIEKHTYNSFMLSEFATKWGRLDVSSINPWNKAVNASFWNFPSAIWVGTSTNSYICFITLPCYELLMPAGRILLNIWSCTSKNESIYHNTNIWSFNVREPSSRLCRFATKLPMLGSRGGNYLPQRLQGSSSRIELGLELLNHF